MPDKMNIDYLKLLLHGEFQKYEVMTISVVGDQSKRTANPNYKTKKHIFLISDYYLLLLFLVKPLLHVVVPELLVLVDPR